MCRTAVLVPGPNCARTHIGGDVQVAIVWALSHPSTLEQKQSLSLIGPADMPHCRLKVLHRSRGIALVPSFVLNASARS